MKLNLDRTNVLILGAWNLAILNPAWMAKKIFEVQKISVNLEVGPTMIARYMSDAHNVKITTCEDKVILNPTSTDPDALEGSGSLAIRLMERLKETPIPAVGVNIGFDLNASEVERVKEAAATKDLEQFKNFGATVESSSIRHQLRINDSDVNTELALYSNGLGALTVNHHFNVSDASEATELLKNRRVSRCRELTDQLAKQVYGLKEG